MRFFFPFFSFWNFYTNVEEKFELNHFFWELERKKSDLIQTCLQRSYKIFKKFIDNLEVQLCLFLIYFGCSDNSTWYNINHVNWTQIIIIIIQTIQRHLSTKVFRRDSRNNSWTKINPSLEKIEWDKKKKKNMLGFNNSIEICKMNNDNM